MPKINTVFFDLDGTLIDTASELHLALNTLLVSCGESEVDVTHVLPHISLGSQNIVKEIFKDKVPQNKIDDLVKQYREIYLTILGTEAKFFDGMSEVLAYLKANNYKWGIITNKLERYTNPLLKNLNITDFDCVVSGDTAEKPKPDAAPVHYACQQLNIKPENSVLIGDSYNDIFAGKAANTKTIFAKYGYIDPNYDYNALNYDHAINKPLEIIDWLESQV